MAGAERSQADADAGGLGARVHTDPNCIFCKIVAGQIPAKKVYEDDDIVAFHDIHPWAPVHILLIPKRHVESMVDVTEADAPVLGRMMALSPRLMRELGVTNGFRHVINTGRDGMQEVPHLHLHVIGGPRPWLKG
jgi:histidine triad (HIT) family protein